MWVGSRCILKFDMNINNDFDGVYNKDEKEKRLNNLVTKKKKNMKIEKSLVPLRLLWKSDDKFRNYIKNTVDFLKKYNSFTPKQIITLDWRFKQNNIKIDTKLLNVRIRNQEERTQIYLMNDWQKDILRNYLTDRTKRQISLKKMSGQIKIIP